MCYEDYFARNDDKDQAVIARSVSFFVIPRSLDSSLALLTAITRVIARSVSDEAISQDCFAGSTMRKSKGL